MLQALLKFEAIQQVYVGATAVNETVNRLRNVHRRAAS